MLGILLFLLAEAFFNIPRTLPPFAQAYVCIDNVKNCVGFFFLTMTLSKPYPIDLTRGKVLFDPSMTFEKVLSRKFSYNRR